MGKERTDIMNEETLQLALVQLKDRMGINYDDDDVTKLTPPLKAAYNYFKHDILYTDTLEVEPETTLFTLIVERARYDLMNSVDIFPKNYRSDIGQLISRYDYDKFKAGV